MSIDQALGQAHSKEVGSFVYPNEHDPVSMAREPRATHRDPPSCHKAEHGMAQENSQGLGESGRLCGVGV